MKRRQLDELADRVAALESVGGAATTRLDARLAALEEAIRRLSRADPEAAEAFEATHRCNDIVSEHVQAGAQVAVAVATDAARFGLDHWPTVAFRHGPPGEEANGRLESGLSAIAHLEAQRVAAGTAFLLVPEPARIWLEQLPELGEHLTRRYEIVADEPEAGVLFDVGARRAEEGRSRTFAEELDRLMNGDRSAAILDWTGLDVAPAIPDRHVFVPPGDDGELPHLDATIEVVVVEDSDRLAEARRVASCAVIRVRPDGAGGVEVLEVEESRHDAEDKVDSVLVVVAADDSEDPWREWVAEAVRGCDSVEVIARPDPWAAPADAEVLVLVERGVLPMPGCIESLAAALGSDAQPSAATAKLLAADGSLEAAGRTVFADGSVASIATGCRAIDAPWHEYVRPVCAATGVLAVRTARARRLSDRPDSLLALSAALWADGHPLIYQPSAHAVRAAAAEEASVAPETKTETETETEAGVEAWEPALFERPDRPVPLDERAWRALLARDDPGEAWR